MPRQRHYYGLNHLHFITASTYRRARLFDSDRLQFVATLAGLRADPSRIVPSLKERTAKFILKNLQANRELPGCGRMLAALTLPPTVHLHGPDRVGRRRFYDLNVWSEKKRREKLNYTHGNRSTEASLRRLTSGRGQASGSISWGMIPSFPWTAYRDRTHRHQRDVCATRVIKTAPSALRRRSPGCPPPAGCQCRIVNTPGRLRTISARVWSLVFPAFGTARGNSKTWTP